MKGRAGHPKSVRRREPGLRLSDPLAFCLNAGAKTRDGSGIRESCLVSPNPGTV